MAPFAGLTPAHAGMTRRKMMALAKKSKGGLAPAFGGLGGKLGCGKMSKRKAGFLAPLAIGVLSSIAPQIFDTIKGIFGGKGGKATNHAAGRKSHKSRAAGKFKKGSPEAKAFMASIRRKRGRGAGGAILTPGPLL